MTAYYAANGVQTVLECYQIGLICVNGMEVRSWLAYNYNFYYNTRTFNDGGSIQSSSPPLIDPRGKPELQEEVLSAWLLRSDA